DPRLGASSQCEVRREVPPGKVNMRLCLLEFLGDPRKRRRTVDQDLERVARARRRVAVGPSCFVSVERMFPSHPPQPAPVVSRDSAVDGLPDLAVEQEERLMSWNRRHSGYNGREEPVSGAKAVDLKRR